MGRSKAPSLPIKALSLCRPTELRGWQRNWIHRGAPRPANPVTCFPPGKVVAPATKGGMHFQRPQGGCMVFRRAKARLSGFCRQRRHKKMAPERAPTFPAERYYIPPEGESPQPVREASAGPGQNPWRPGPKARRRHQPSRRSRVNLREYRKAPPRSRSRPRRRAPEPSSPPGRSPQRWEKISSAPLSSSTSRSQCLFSASFLILSASFGTITLSV